MSRTPLQIATLCLPISNCEIFHLLIHTNLTSLGLSYLLILLLLLHSKTARASSLHPNHLEWQK